MYSRVAPFLIVFVILDVYACYILSSYITEGHWVLLPIQLFFLFLAGLSFMALRGLYRSIEKHALFKGKKINRYLSFLIVHLITVSVFCILFLLRSVLMFFITFISRLLDVSQVGSWLPVADHFMGLGILVITLIVFLILVFGLTKGRTRYRVEKQSLVFPELPKGFHNYRIVQISDIHAGSFHTPSEVEKGVQLILEQKADLILFTGDLVNHDKDEIDPYISQFSKLVATDGVHAVLGNHDYYGTPREVERRAAYWSDFYAKFEALNWNLMNNESLSIDRGAESIHLIGVENWGKGPWFPKRGDIKKAMTGISQTAFKILMSHDPTHWDHEIKKYPNKVNLTLSGHTHAMQFGIRFFGHQWSPSKYRYPHWMGLYEENGRYLYVNRGFGCLGFPGRIGMWPEVTLIELKCAAEKA